MSVSLTKLQARVRDHRRLVAVGILLPLLVAPFVLSGPHTELIVLGYVFVMLGVSWNLLGGYAGQISLGHAAFFGFGAFVSAWLTTPSAAGLPAWTQVPDLVAILGGAVAAGLLALAIGPAIFRLRGHYFTLGTFALAAIIQLLLENARDLSGGSTGYFLNPGNELVRYYYGLGLAILTVVGTYFLVRSKIGLGMRAVRDDERTAKSLGVWPLKYKLIAFSITSFMAGAAGGVFAQFTLYVNPESTLDLVWTVDAVVIAIIGGVGTLAGPIIGAGIYLVIQELVIGYAGRLSITLQGLILIVFIIFFPHGIWGTIKNRLGL